MGPLGRALLFASALLGIQPSPVQDIPVELASKIATFVAPVSEVTIVSVSGESSADETGRDVAQEVGRLLAARGIRVVPRAAVTIALTCGENARERACLAEIRRGGARDAVSATRPRDPHASIRPAAPAIELTPLFRQRAAILDAVRLGDRLIVLDPAALAVYQADGPGWKLLRSQPLPRAHPWPRDVRGRLHLDGASVDALLPGTTCRADAGLASVACVDDRRAWPLAVDNTGIDPARNYFSTPEGFAFFGAADLDSAADARWIVSDRVGTLVLLDAARRPVSSLPSPTLLTSADDVIGLSAACGGGSPIVVASRADEAHDALRLFHVIGRRLVPDGPAMVLAGSVTALWAAPSPVSAMAVVRLADADLYEAFQLHLSCAR